MNEENQVTEQKMIPYYVHEGEMARQERHIKRLWILCLVIFAALVVTNAGWIYYENQFEDVTMTVTQDTPSWKQQFCRKRWEYNKWHDRQ